MAHHPHSPSPVHAGASTASASSSLSSAAAAAAVTTATAAAPGHAMRRFRVRLMSGDEAAFELDGARRIRDLKRAIAGERALGTPPVSRQRLVLMPAHGGREPHEVLADGRVLSACGDASGETELELVVMDAPAEIPKIPRVRVCVCECEYSHDCITGFTSCRATRK